MSFPLLHIPQIFIRKRQSNSKESVNWVCSASVQSPVAFKKLSRFSFWLNLAKSPCSSTSSILFSHTSCLKFTRCPNLFSDTRSSSDAIFPNSSRSPKSRLESLLWVQKKPVISFLVTLKRVSRFSAVGRCCRLGTPYDLPFRNSQSSFSLSGYQSLVVSLPEGLECSKDWI